VRRSRENPFNLSSGSRLLKITAIFHLQASEKIPQHLIVTFPVVIVVRRPEKRT
jgi:hypothetical protein